MANLISLYPLAAVRALALHSQGLATRPGSEPVPTRDAIYAAVEQVGCVQIDTLHMVRRSHYLVLWSRLGRYDPADLDRLASGADRRFFEYWLHEACLIPLSEYRYRLPVMRRHRENGRRWWVDDWHKQPETAALLDEVLARVRQNGGVRSADFDHPEQRQGWWDWKPAKRALEYLYDCGELMIAERVNFQRIYDLTERVLPDWVDRSEPTVEEMRLHLIERSAWALGACEPGQLADYTHMRRGDAKPFVEQLTAAGVLVNVQAETADGKTRTLAVHRDALPLLEQAADGALPAQRTTFLSPFDSLWWARGRDEQFWGFQQRLEAYKPEPQRIWGYFCLPILHQDRLVGRFDPKLERKSATLRLKALYLEPGVAPDEMLVAAVAGAMRDFLAFHEARDLIVERSDPPEFGVKLLAAL